MSREVIASVQASLLASAPARAEEIGRFFSSNASLLLLTADRLSRTRTGTGNIIADVRAELTAAAAPSARELLTSWFDRNQPLLALIARRLSTALPAPAVVLAEPDIPELWSPQARTAANLAAIALLDTDATLSASDRDTLRKYSGWGGLSLDKVTARIPEKWLPDIQALAHEYYTPLSVTREAARLLQPLLAKLSDRLPLPLLALEPSAGIGRFVAAFPELSWHAVEYSKVSAAILSRLYPSAQVSQGSFEEWVVQNEASWAGRFALVASNPPYGRRGAFEKVDPSPEYRESQAYLYFLRRGLDLLAPRGVGCYLIPYGFLSSRVERFVDQRERVLRRHHLLCAFRLPSGLFPGGNIVTDLVFFQARGGELSASLPEDGFVVAGNYFVTHPRHILGTVVGSEEDEGDKRARRGYEIAGSFSGLPETELRPLCESCAVTPFLRVSAPKKAGLQLAELPEWLQDAALLGERVSQYLAALSGQDEANQRAAAGLYSELREALLAFASTYQKEKLGGPGSESIVRDPKLQAAAKSFPALVAFVAAWNRDGSLASAFSTVPTYRPKYHGDPDDYAGMALFLYETERRVTLPRLLDLRASLGRDRLVPRETVEAALLAASFAHDGDEWSPESAYYTGDLWPKYDRAKARADAGDITSAQQAKKLLLAIGPVPYPEIAPEPRAGFLPAPLLREWLADYAGVRAPELERKDGLLRIQDKPLQALLDLAPRLAWAFGYLNHDLGLFAPTYVKKFLPDEKREETASEALDRARLEYHAAAVKHFGEWMGSRGDRQAEVEESYARMARGWVQPVYPAKDLELVRWRGHLKLRPHQLSAAWRLVSLNGGLVALDVGLGKTLTGIATIARLRQTDRARRVMVVVPNSIVWKWHKEFSRAVPDYRVGVIGSVRYRGRDGLLKSRTDTAAERALKYRLFQAGAYDCVLVTFSAFGRSSLKKDTLGRFVTTSPTVQRSLGLRARNELHAREQVASGKRKPKKAKDTVKLATLDQIRKALGAEAVANIDEARLAELGAQVGAQIQREKALREEQLDRLLATLKTVPERERAIFELRLQEWIAERTDNPDADPGVVWEDLNVDLLVVDEAQNFKNLWPVEDREGGIPRYLGAISEGSQRAWDLALRAFDVRERNHGGGVVLLSATPAKNSPLEYFGLVGMVAADAWARVGIGDPEQFIDRYLRLEMRQVLQQTLRVERQSVVAGFRNLNELRDVLFRFAEFRTAEEVGLKLPEVKPQTLTVQMTDKQRSLFSALLDSYRSAMERADEDPGARFAALGLLQRMALVAVHPELGDGAPPKEEVSSLVADATNLAMAIAAPATADEEPEVDGFGRPLPVGEKTELQEPKRTKPARIPWTWRNAKLAKDYSSPKLATAVKLVRAQPGCGHIIFCDNIAVHYWMRELLVQAGIPAERIGILNGEVTPTALARQEIAERFNGTPAVTDERGRVEQEGVPPQLDVVIANATAYEGIDLQIRTCQVIHLDLPWEPATLQQRNGRAVRQGNTQAVIAIYYLVADRSNDQVRLDVIQGKLGWMRDVLASSDRETNNPAADQEMSAEEMLTLGSDDPEASRRALAELKARRERATEQQTRKRAWEGLAGIARRIGTLPKQKEPATQAAAHEAIEREVTLLEQVPADLWPWHHLLGPARQRIAMAVDAEAEIAVVQDSFITRVEGELATGGFEVGLVSGQSASLRPHGSLIWHSLPVGALRNKSELPFGLVLSPDGPQPGDYATATPGASYGERAAVQEYWAGSGPSSDASKTRTSFVKLLERSGPAFPDSLEWQGASDRFRRWLWETAAERIMAALRQESPGKEPPLLPGLTPEGELEVFWAGSALARLRLLPFTEEGYALFLRAVPTLLGQRLADGTELTWSRANALVKDWWQRELPRGLSRGAADDEHEGG